MTGSEPAAGRTAKGRIESDSDRASTKPGAAITAGCLAGLPSFRRWPALWPIGIAILALVFRLSLGAWSLDDAFITFRYASNLAAGRGLVYNPGEVVLGTSTPLYAGLLALLSVLTGRTQLPEIAAIVNGVADSASVLLTFFIARRLKVPKWGAILACVLVAVSPLIVRYSIGGMETSVLTAVLLSAFFLYLADHSAIPFHLAGVAVWLRPDALAFAAALLLVEGLRSRAVPWRPGVIVLSWLGLGILATTVGYGEPLPQSILAKAQHVYRMPLSTNLLQHIYLFSGITLTGVQGLGARGLVLGAPASLAAFASVILLPFLATWALGVRNMIREDLKSWVVPTYIGIFVATYSLLGLRGSLMAEWYLIPLIPFWLLGLMAGFGSIARPDVPVSRRIAGHSGAIVLLALALTALNWGRDRSRPLLLPLNVWRAREDLYVQAAEILEASGAQDALVAASEIGALGYACDCRILDTVGLVSPEAVRYYPIPEEALVSNYAIPVALISDLGPDYVVTLEVFIRKTLLADPDFRRDYTLVWEAPTDAFASRGLMVFARRRMSAP